MNNKNSFDRIEEMEIEKFEKIITPLESKKHVKSNLNYVRNSGAVVESFFNTTIKLFVSLLGGKKQ